jgi:hypothetical protein
VSGESERIAGAASAFTASPPGSGDAAFKLPFASGDNRYQATAFRGTEKRSLF